MSLRKMFWYIVQNFENSYMRGVWLIGCSFLLFIHTCESYKIFSNFVNHIFSIWQILKKWKFNKTFRQFIDFEKAYDSIRRESLYKILNLVYQNSQIKKICLDGTQSKVPLRRVWNREIPHCHYYLIFLCNILFARYRKLT